MNLSNYTSEVFEEPLGAFHYFSMGNVQPLFHWHPHYEITMIERGAYILESNTTLIKSDKPIVIIHRPYCLHRLNADKSRDYVRHIVYITKSILSEFSEKLIDLSLFATSSMIIVHPDEEELSELVSLAEKLSRTVGNKWQPVSKPDLSKGSLLAALIMSDVLGILKSGRGETYSTRHSYIQDVLQNVTENLSEPKTVDELAEKFGVGHTKLASDFRQATGKPSNKYLPDLRMTRARELILSGSSIINASLETGYSSEAHFIKAFREYYGMTPSVLIKERTPG